MLNRASSSKAKFTCKKIAYLENLRFRRDEAIRETTRRKRLERTFFLSEVSHEVSKLSHEAVQSILNQTSLFHIYKTVNTDETEFVEDDLNLKKLDCSSLVTLLVKECYKTPQNKRLLFKLVENATTRLGTFSFAELGQIAYCLLELPQEIVAIIGHKLLVGVFKRVNNIRLEKNLHYTTSLAKLAFVLAKSQLKHDGLLRKIMALFPLDVARTCDTYEEEIHLISHALILTGIENLEFVFKACDYYAGKLQDSIDSALNYAETLSRTASVFMLQGEDIQLVDLKRILVLDKCLKTFGYNHKPFLTKLHDYIDLATVNTCLHPQILQKLSMEALHDIGTNYILNNNAFRHFLVKHNPQTADSALLYALHQKYMIYHPETAEADLPTGQTLENDSSKVPSQNRATSEISVACNEYFEEPTGHTFDKVRDALLKMARALPRVIWWPSIPLILKVFSMHKDYEMLPLLRSYLEEAYLKESDAVEILEASVPMFDVFSYKPGDANLLILDGFLRIMGLCMEPLIRISTINLDALVYLICIYVKIPNSHTADSEDIAALFGKLERSIVDYITMSAMSKTIPNGGLSPHVARMYLDACTFSNVIGDYSNLCQDMGIFNQNVNYRMASLLSFNNTLVRHLLYQSLLALQSWQCINGTSTRYPQGEQPP